MREEGLLSKYKDKSIQNDFAAEKKSLMDLNGVGLKQGFAVGIGTFFALRFGRKFVMRRLTSKVHEQQQRPFGSYKFGTNQVEKLGFAEAQQQWKPRPEGLVTNMFRTLLEVALSLNAAVLATTYWTDTDEILNKAADIPLIEGRSIVCDQLCDDFIEEYQSIPPEFWHNLNKSRPDSSPTKAFLAIEKFVQNCMKRRIYESQLTEQEGSISEAFKDHKDIEIKLLKPYIPQPGVPQDIDISYYNKDDKSTAKFDEINLDSFMDEEFADGLDDISSDFIDQTKDWDSVESLEDTKRE